LPARFDQNFGSAFDFHRVSSKIKNRFGFIFRGDDKLIKRARKSLERKSEIFLDKILDSVKSHETNDFYDFSGFRLDARKRRLWRGGEVVALTPKEFEVLFFLVKRAGQVVEKEELLDAIWADVYVEETTLARNVSWLRQKLSAASGGAKLIETVPKRGYRFLPEVIRSENAPVVRIEEKIVQRIVIEETITLDEAEAIPASNDLSFAESDAATPKLLNPQPEINNRKSFRLSLAFAFVALAAIGFAVYQYFSYKSVPKVIVAARPAPFSGLPGRENYPAFSPDGKLLAYVWNGGAARRLTLDASREILPAWSADGQWIYFNSNRGGGPNIWKMPATGGELIQITRQGGFESFAAPDGRTIFFTKSQNSVGLWQISVDGDTESPIAELSEAAYWRYWTMAKSGIYFVARAEQPPYKIKFYDFSKAQIKEVAATDIAPIWTYTGLSAAVNGESILYVQSNQNASSIVLAELPENSN